MQLVRKQYRDLMVYDGPNFAAELGKSPAKPRTEK
jgi:hypothetical protein